MNLGTHKQLVLLAVVAAFAGCGDESEPSAELEFRDAETVAVTPREPAAPPTHDDITDEPTGEPMTPVEEPPATEPEPEPQPQPQPEPEPQPCLLDEGCIDTFPTRIVDTTVGGTRLFDTYACRPETDESGPERMYRVVVPEAGFLAAEVLDEGLAVDVDVHLLLENDDESCMDRGNFTAGAYVDPGTYWIAADTWVDRNGTEYAGDFEIAINLVRPDDLAAHGLNTAMAGDALTAFRTAWQRGDSKRFEYAMTDFSMHSRLKRQWIVHLATGELLYNLHVGHGEASAPGNDPGLASVFSNTPQSHQSSLGMLRTAETYVGDYGYSMRLDGLEAGFNSNVRDRFIVVHPWDGSSQEYVNAAGQVALTWGCPAITPAVSTPVVDTISGGALMFFWYPDATYQNTSTYLN